MRSRARLTAAAALAALAAAGCGDEKRSDTTSGQADAPATQGAGPTAPGAAVTFTSPADGATTGTRFTARIELERFEIDPGAVGKSAVPGKGHLHFRLDGGRFDNPENAGENGKVAKRLGVDGKYSPATAPAITYEKIPPGRHALEVYLANNDHTDTGVQARTQFTVE